jgi:hypothetical protein
MNPNQIYLKKRSPSLSYMWHVAHSPREKDTKNIQ